MLTLINLDKMQNISTLMRKKFEIWWQSILKVIDKWNWFKPSSKILLQTVTRR